MFLSFKADYHHIIVSKPGVRNLQFTGHTYGLRDHLIWPARHNINVISKTYKLELIII